MSLWTLTPSCLSLSLCLYSFILYLHSGKNDIPTYHIFIPTFALSRDATIRTDVYRLGRISGAATSREKFGPSANGTRHAINIHLAGVAQPQFINVTCGKRVSTTRKRHRQARKDGEILHLSLSRSGGDSFSSDARFRILRCTALGCFTPRPFTVLYSMIARMAKVPTSLKRYWLHKRFVQR